MTTPTAKESGNLSRGGSGEGGKEEGEEGGVGVGCGEGSYWVSQPMVPIIKDIYILFSPCYLWLLIFSTIDKY